MFGRKKDRREETAVADATVQTVDEEYVTPPKGLKKVGNFFKSVKTAINYTGNAYGFINDFVKNKEQVKRRLNIIFFCIMFGFAVITGLSFLFGGMLDRVALGWNIAVYTVFGLYGVTLVGFVVAELIYRRNVTVRTTKRYIKVIAVFQKIVQMESLVMSIITFAITVIATELTGADIAVRVIVQILSVVMFVLSLFSNISKGIYKFILWLKSPVNGKRQFRFVATEWYTNVLSDDKQTKKIKSVKKVKEERYEGIGRAIDEYLVRYLGKKYICDIREGDITAAIEKIPPEDRDDAEGTLKQIFDYAVERGMIVENPCGSLKLAGNVEKAKKNVKTDENQGGFWSGLFGKRSDHEN